MELSNEWEQMNTLSGRIALYYKLIDKNYEKIQKIEEESSYFMTKINELVLEINEKET